MNIANLALAIYLIMVGLAELFGLVTSVKVQGFLALVAGVLFLLSELSVYPPERR